MNFDDYNYKGVNNYVLITAPKNLTDKISDLKRLLGETEESENQIKSVKLT